MKRRPKRNDRDGGRAIVADRTEFERICDAAREAGFVAFDTEFVSDQSFRPLLCLLQVNVGGELSVVDPLAIEDFSPWWDVVADDDTEVVVHGGQAEIRFCLEATGKPPGRFVDVQVAEGLLGRSYPLSYTNLVSRVLGQSVGGKQTRTDWKRRPLSDRQIDYALEDVIHLPEIWHRQEKSLRQLGRREWAEAEFQRRIDEVVRERARKPWERLSGTHKLSRRELAVLRELAVWRETEAERRDRLTKRILRDDLLMEVARRQPRSREQLLETRDFNRGDYRSYAEDIVAAVERGLAVPESELPDRVGGRRRERDEDEHVLGQLAGIALANRCAEAGVSMSLVGTSSDLRELVRWHVTDRHRGPKPLLMQGWRAELCGDLLIDVLEGRIALRVADVESDHPLVFERRD